MEGNCPGAVVARRKFAIAGMQTIIPTCTAGGPRVAMQSVIIVGLHQSWSDLQQSLHYKITLK